MKYYTNIVPFEIGKLLKDAGYWDPGCTYESSYNKSCYYVPSGKFYGEGVIADWADVVPAPTYAEVFDWLLTNEIVVCIDYETITPLTWTCSVQLIGEKFKEARKNGDGGFSTTKNQFDDFNSCVNRALTFILTNIIKKYDTITNNQ